MAMETTFVIERPADRKRNCKSKVRTGCSTCKIRHLKCDEGKPHCQKCVSSGRTCPGYDVFVQSKIRPTSRSLLKVNPAPLLPNATKEERSSFDLFQSCIVKDFCGIFDGSWWSPYILKVAVSEPMILHAALAFASVNEVASNNDTFVWKQYSKAITHLQTSLNRSDDKDPTVLLLACLLLTSFGFAHNRSDEAITHLRGGSAVLAKLEATRKLGDTGETETTDIAERCTVNAFRRLDLITTLSVSTRPFPNSFSYWEAKKSIVMDPLALNAVGFLRERLGSWITEVVCLTHNIHELGEPGTSPSLHDDPLHIRVQELVAASNQWFATFKETITHTIPAISCPIAKEQARKAVSLLRLHHRSASIMLATSLNYGREMAFDDYIDEFRAIVDLAYVLAPHFQRRATAFTLDIGIISTLYYTTTKCRDPVVRHRALDLLSSLKHHEGAWSAQTSAGSARRIVKLEEEAAQALMPGIAITTAAQIPEMARIHDAYVDVRSSKGLVCCKRRRFESDGEWIFWQVEVD